MRAPQLANRPSRSRALAPFLVFSLMLALVIKYPVGGGPWWLALIIATIGVLQFIWFMAPGPRRPTARKGSATDKT